MYAPVPPPITAPGLTLPHRPTAQALPPLPPHWIFAKLGLG
ncbi:hypothetical protein GFS31_27390 [Leptolyngbya sp. BL0902]|nr:hypothetical protein [Leptolyngbya sp. BL0902]QQE66044.1 hypothetical protein GFS31_27390 [Leptolyngbya sp. BL0902]